MKKKISALLLPFALLIFFLWFNPRQFAAPAKRLGSTPHLSMVKNDSLATMGTAKSELTNKGKEIVAYAMRFLGSPYVYAGMSAKGFDCSGFTAYVFRNYSIKIPHSSALQSQEGVPVARNEAQPGDLVIFTGTNPKIRKPGHVGIVISAPGDTIQFVHSSSVGGVKVSKVKGTRYDTRFLGVRRVL
ncbi:NlpC/P60 family protein [Pontibacter ummariensis]|uniref:NlpC/P60 family protein n=1 Tax=Pontibacter ummariensis TaxID=1610492 RepID=A0A239FA41_9BACT|nr:C40 family peptidase [Pontibacter ummariensis]PRY12375.1 NlpC/P60 family protein [Pontibacter ummariensis]SNS53173.1 NlpC/P60 family protein [Pontibacter ummariensis]